jgi:hypothetical protein
MHSIGRIVAHTSLLFLFLSLSLPLLVGPVHAVQTSQVTINPTDDTYIDSGNPGSTFGASANLAALSYSAYYGFSNRTEQSWLKFSLASIPPSANIINALLSMRLSYTIVNQNIGLSGELVNSWNEGTLSWNNAPRNYVSSSFADSNFVSNSTTVYNWRVGSLVNNAMANGVVSFVLQPTSSQGISNGWAIFYSNEAGASQAPGLIVTYSYVSVALTLSSNVVSTGSFVSIVTNTDPPQPGGAIVLQYSTDQTNWNVIASQTGGAYSYSWGPLAKGAYYVRAYWTVSWGGGTYTATSATNVLTVSGAASVITLNAPSSASLNQTVQIAAILHDTQNNPISGSSVFFSIDTKVIGSGLTNSSGVVKITYKLNQPAGSRTISASYTGSQSYSPAITHAILVINPWKLVVSGNAPRVPLVSVNGRNQTTDSSGTITIFVNSSGTYTIRVNNPLTTGAGARIIFMGWGDGTTSQSRSVIVTSDISLSVNTKQQYFLGLQSTFNSPVGAGWYDSGSRAAFSVQPALDQGNGTRRVFAGWIKGGQPFATSANGSLTVTSSTNLVAGWKKQYFLNLVSQYGNPSGGGWFDPGASVNASVSSPFSKTNDTRFLTTGFTGTGSAPQAGSGASVTFSLNTPGMLTFNWKTQYFVKVITAYASARGAGWYDAGSSATISVNQTSISVSAFLTKRFAGWSGDLTSTSSSARLTVDGPKRVSAVWTDDLTNAYITGGGITVVVVAAGVYLLRGRIFKRG